MKFSAFKMAQFSAQWPPGSLENMHSSNPAPLNWLELSHLLGMDLNGLMQKTPFNYEPTQGNAVLREQISTAYFTEINTDDVVLTSGAQEAIFLVMQALLSPGDQVITFTPSFEPLVKVAEEIGANVAALPLDESKGWAIDWEQLKSTFSNNTQLLVINFPHNPTGKTISSDELKRLVSWCQKHDCWLFSDEVFRGLEHANADKTPAAADLYDKAISMGVMSKALALPGIRLGWLVSRNIKLIEQLMAIKSHLSICQSSLDAQLCQAIIPSSEKLWQRNLKIILSNKALINQLLSNHDTMTWHEPTGSATAFIQLKNQSGESYAQDLAQHKGLLVLPDSVFLTQQRGFRLTLGRIDSDSLFEQIFAVNQLN